MLRKLLEYDFDIAGSMIIDNNNEVNYRIHIPEYKSQKHGQVYAWVIGEEIVYIGMAGKGVAKRLSEHRGGWRGGSPTGILKEAQIRNELEAGRHITIYGRTSDYFEQEVEILGKKQNVRFSLVSQEEDALLTEFQPSWNTNGLK
tara:strand:+ start:9358 stop:9792 length:435 start_codon:yes stop_codon:yes gene_type:complete